MNPRPLPPAGQAAAASSDPGAVPGDVRDQIRRLQDDGGSYRAIAAAAGLAPATVHGLRSGRRQPTPATEQSPVQGHQQHPAPRPHRRRRLPAAAARPARHGPRLRPHRPRPGRPRDDHPRASSAATPQPSAPGSATRSPTCTTPGGTSAPPNAPASSTARPPPPAAAPSPATGAPAPASTTTNSTSPATAPPAAGNPPPAPASPPTSTRPHDPASQGRTHDQPPTARPGRRHRSPPTRSNSCWPPWTTPPNTSATGPPPAPTAPTSPAPPANGDCRPPTPTTTWPPR